MYLRMEKMNNVKLSFDDVLINTKFSFIKSRKDVSVLTPFLGLNIFPVISSNMDTVTNSTMATAMRQCGALGALHRFMSVEDNVKEYLASPPETIVSIGLGSNELDRAKALISAGAKRILIDVAHGASIEVVKQTIELRKMYSDSIYIIVGNFANKESIKDFKYYLGGYKVDAWKIGIGSGSACLTRKVTGCGTPCLASIIDCSEVTEPIIADGGIRDSDDFAKALAAGATVVMLGGMLAGTDESPSDPVGKVNVLMGWSQSSPPYPVTKSQPEFKKYRGSASQESYVVQGKESEWRHPEGDSFLVPYVGPLAKVINKLETGLRSAMSYVGANTLEEFKESAELIQITNAGMIESSSHGKK
jgi:IMP dehydrogenase